jgi:hypothetical protein
MTIYNPVKQPAALDAVRDIYWNSVTARVLVESVFLLAGVASVVAIVVAVQ